MGKNYFDQFDTVPTMQLSTPPGVTEIAPLGGSPLISLPTIGASQANAARAQSAGNFFDQFDLQSGPPSLPTPPSLPDWMTNPAPADWGDVMQLIGIADASPSSRSGTSAGPMSANTVPMNINSDGSDYDPFGASAASDPPTVMPQQSLPQTANFPAAIPPVPSALPAPATSTPKAAPKLLYSRLILGMKNAFGGDYGKTRQWFADNGYGDLLRSGAPSQPSMFDRYWTMLDQYDADKQQADAARKVGFGEAFTREGLRGLAGITEYENRLLLPAYWGIDAASRALTGYDPGLSAIPDAEAEQRNSLAIQPYEELTIPGQIGAGFGGALPMVATAPIAGAALPEEALATVPEIAPTLWNATKEVAARIPRGIGAMMPSAALAAQDVADQGGSPQDQLKAASLTMAMGAIPMMAESGASSLPLRIAERGAKSAALAIPVNAFLNNLQDPSRRTTAGFTAEDVISAIPQIVTGALTGGRELPFRAQVGANTGRENPILRRTNASTASDPFLDRMRAALDGDATRRIHADDPLKREESVPIERLVKPSDPNAPVTPVEVSLLGLSRDSAIAKRQIRAFISRLLQGRTFTIRSTGTDVRITAESRGESISKARRVEQAAPMRDADRLIENAYFVDSRPPMVGKPKAEASRAYTTFAVPVAINGELYASHFTVREPRSYPPNSGIFYEFNLGPKIVGADVAMGLDHSAPASVAPKVTIQQLVNAVKAYKAGNSPLDHMRAALDGDAARNPAEVPQPGASIASLSDRPIPSRAAVWRKGPVEVTELKSPMFNQPVLKDAWRAARTWVRGLFATAHDKGGILNRDTGDRLTSSGKFIDHGLQPNSERHPNLRQHIQAAEVLDNLIERAVKIVDYAPSKGDKESGANLLRIYRYAAPFRVDGRTYLVKLTAKEYAGDGHKYYDHRLTEIKELTEGREPSGQARARSLPVSGATSKRPAINMRDLLRDVKLGDLSSTLPLVDPNWSDGSLDHMRAALDADAKLRGIERPITSLGHDPETAYYRNRTGEAILVKIEPMQIRKKFKHSIDFGIPKGYNADNSKALIKIISRHISDPNNRVIEGTYRGIPVVHIFDRRTGVDVIVDANGKFVSGWKLNKNQLQNLLARGSL